MMIIIRMKMYSDVSDLIAQGKLLPPPCQLVSLDNYKEVLDNTLRGFLPAKYVFRFE